MVSKDTLLKRGETFDNVCISINPQLIEQGRRWLIIRLSAGCLYSPEGTIKESQSATSVADNICGIVVDYPTFTYDFMQVRRQQEYGKYTTKSQGRRVDVLSDRKGTAIGNLSDYHIASSHRCQVWNCQQCNTDDELNMPEDEMTTEAFPFLYL